MKMTKNLTHIASKVEFEPAMSEEQLEAARTLRTASVTS